MTKHLHLVCASRAILDSLASHVPVSAQHFLEFSPTQLTEHSVHIITIVCRSFSDLAILGQHPAVRAVAFLGYGIHAGRRDQAVVEVK